MDFVAPTPSLPNRSVLGFADTYFEAGTLLYHEERGRGFYLPATNLLCHSIELYLKSLINPGTFNSGDYEGFTEVTERREGHKLSDLLEDMERNYNDELTEARWSLESDLIALEGLFQATRYPFEGSNKEQITQGKDEIAFAVAQFLNHASKKLKPMLVHQD